jgi:hypothetical protein
MIVIEVENPREPRRYGVEICNFDLAVPRKFLDSKRTSYRFIAKAPRRHCDRQRTE